MKRDPVIYECQPGLFDCPTSERDGYRFVSTSEGLYLFENAHGDRELFAKRGTAYAGWHLRRGRWFYEFVRSAERGAVHPDLITLLALACAIVAAFVYVARS